MKALRWTLIISLALLNILQPAETCGQANPSSAYRAREVKDIGVQPATPAFYQEQSAAWRDRVESNRKDANAWLNFYKSERYSGFTPSSNELSDQKQGRLDKIVQEMESSVPSSFEYHYVKYWNGNHDPKLFTHLQQAYTLQPNNAELYDDFIAHYEVTGNRTKRQEFCSKWVGAGKVEQGVLDYNYNVLMSVEPGAILITNGEYDTYPIWSLEARERNLPNVTVLYLDLLHIAEYRNRVLSGLGIGSIPFSSKRPEDFIRSLAAKRGAKPLYLALTVEPKILKTFDQKLYLTGLTLKWSEERIDNLTLLEKNWDQKFRKAVGGTGNLTKKMSRNYLAPMLLLRQHYQSQGNAQKAKELEKSIRTLAAESGKAAEVEKFLK